MSQATSKKIRRILRKVNNDFIIKIEDLYIQGKYNEAVKKINN